MRSPREASANMIERAERPGMRPPRLAVVPTAKRAERRGIRLTHEAVAARPNVPCDQALNCHTRQLSPGRIDRATRHPVAMSNQAFPDATFQAGPPNGMALSRRERSTRLLKSPGSRAKRSAAAPG